MFEAMSAKAIFRGLFISRSRISRSSGRSGEGEGEMIRQLKRSKIKHAFRYSAPNCSTDFPGVAGYNSRDVDFVQICKPLGEAKISLALQSGSDAAQYPIGIRSTRHFDSR
jgi:hypothetical protein